MGARSGSLRQEALCNVEAERAVLSAVLINPRAIGAAVEVLGEDADAAFGIRAHALVYDACLECHRQGLPIDLVTVVDVLTRSGQLEAAGGLARVAEISGASPTSANVAHYAGIVRNGAVARALHQVCTAAAAQALESDIDVETLVEDTERKIFGLAHHSKAGSIRSSAELVGAAYATLERQVREPGHVDGLLTGLYDLDALTGGLQPADMVIVAARPSVGKTAFALNVAQHVALVGGKGVLVVSLEMSASQLEYRLLCSTGAVDTARVRDGFCAEKEIPKAQAAAGRLNTSLIQIDEVVSLTPLELRSRVRRHAALHLDLALVIIDYIQLMHTAGRSENRQNEISEISRAIKAVAREVGVPVIALSQLSREAEKTGDGVPQLSHLRDSGAIEQDADLVCLLYRPPWKERKEHPDDVILHVAKHRNGPTGHVRFLFHRDTQRFLRSGAAAAPVAANLPYAGDDDPFEDEDLYGRYR